MKNKELSIINFDLSEYFIKCILKNRSKELIIYQSFEDFIKYILKNKSTEMIIYQSIEDFIEHIVLKEYNHKNSVKVEICWYNYNYWNVPWWYYQFAS